MKSIIFVFSGTGNSLSIAKVVQSMLDSKLVRITKDHFKEYPLKDYDMVGFILPVYYSTIPNLVKAFILTQEFSKEQYIFAITTSGQYAYLSHKHLARYIKMKCGELSYAKQFSMPGNYIVKYGAFPEKLQKKIIKKNKEPLLLAIEEIKNRKTNKIFQGGLWNLIEHKYLQKMQTIKNESLNFSVDGCISCGMCTQLCPANNISLVEGKPRFGNECELCVACIQWCPKAAINYSDKTKGRKRYHHPDISKDDIIYG